MNFHFDTKFDENVAHLWPKIYSMMSILNVPLLNSTFMKMFISSKLTLQTKKKRKKKKRSTSRFLTKFKTIIRNFYSLFDFFFYFHEIKHQFRPLNFVL